MFSNEMILTDQGRKNFEERDRQTDRHMPVLIGLGAMSSRSRCQQGWFSPRAVGEGALQTSLSLAVSGSHLPVSSQGLSSVCLCPTLLE